MNELYELVNKLKLSLDNLDDIKNIKTINKELDNNKELLDKIKLFRKTNDLNIKKEILKENLFKEYKKSEGVINLLILDMNSKLKELVPRRNHENN